MSQGRQVKVCITREEGGITLAPQKNDDLLVLQPLMSDVHSDLMHREPRGFQQQTLTLKDVLVENDQASTRAGAYSSEVYWSE